MQLLGDWSIFVIYKIYSFYTVNAMELPGKKTKSCHDFCFVTQENTKNHKEAAHEMAGMGKVVKERDFRLFWGKGQKKWYTRRDSNSRPSTPEADALSS